MTTHNLISSLSRNQNLFALWYPTLCRDSQRLFVSSDTLCALLAKALSSQWLWSSCVMVQDDKTHRIVSIRAAIKLKDNNNHRKTALSGWGISERLRLKSSRMGMQNLTHVPEVGKHPESTQNFLEETLLLFPTNTAPLPAYICLNRSTEATHSHLEPPRAFASCRFLSRTTTHGR